MAFLIESLDGEGRSAIRESQRAAHAAFLEENSDLVLSSGPMTSDDGLVERGTFILADVDDRSRAKVIAATDPYAMAGLYEAYRLTRVRLGGRGA